MTDPNPTGWCWNCGRPCSGSFCHDRCRRGYTRTQAVLERRQVRRGKRAGYGIAGDAH